MTVKQERLDFSSFIFEYKETIYPILFYISGLIVGTALYKALQSTQAEDLIKSIVQAKADSFLNLYINRLGLYTAIYVLTMLLGMCLIGYPFICIIPLVTGIVVAFKLTCLYLNYGIKGIGYSLLMVVPQTAMIETVLIISVLKAGRLSKTIYKETTNKTALNENINLKSYVKSFLLYYVITAAVAAANACTVYLLSTIIHL